ncbi:translation initiation factor SUI1 [Kalaharituber pfeilii]|nr:translation initiation factor SUI1 [Kalaharituber pfeilii]
MVSESQAKKVVYCGVCSLPPKYCEFGGTTKNYTVATSPSRISIEAQAKAEKDAAKKAARAAKAEEADAIKKAASKVILKRIERTKRKHVIVITGLRAFGLDLKKVAKELGKKFACGSSEIVVQGDLSDEIEEFLLEKYKDVPADNIEPVEDKKKNAAAGPS